jgi:hypothetical protein
MSKQLALSSALSVFAMIAVALFGASGPVQLEAPAVAAGSLLNPQVAN